MNTVKDTAAEACPIALLLVHGIGDQKRGESLDGFLDGLGGEFANALQIQRVSPTEAELTSTGLRRVHVFEVYWADLLAGEIVEDTFDFNRVFEAVWFPRLNRQAGLLTDAECPGAKVRRWTWILAPLTALLHAGLWGASFLAALPAGAARAIRETRQRDKLHPGNRDYWRQQFSLRKRPHRTAVDHVMDQVVGDVFNYVQGSGDAFPDPTDKTDRIGKNVAAIRGRFESTAKLAVDRGCREIQVLAHSLGTVAAFHSMSRAEAPTTRSDEVAKVTRIYTIGSPLEKIRFFWTKLIAQSRGGPVIYAADQLIAQGSIDEPEPTRWYNFYSPVDLVSGRLGRFVGWPSVQNSTAAGLGGLMTAHVAYHSNAAFLDLLAREVFGGLTPVRVSRTRRVLQWCRGVLESVALPVLIILLSALGFAIMGAFAWATGWIISRPLAWLGLAGWANGVTWYFPIAILFVMTGGVIINGRHRAAETHRKYWLRDPPEPF